MSLAIRAAKSRYSGDPGLFDSIWGGIKGAVGGFVKGGPLGAISGAIAGSKGTPSVPPVLRLPQSATGQAMPGTGIQVQLPQVGGLNMGQINVGSFQPQGGAMVTPGQATGSQMCQLPGGGVVMRATHANKSGYWLKSGQYVAPGSKCVANRRMNPLNPRAVSRALRRVVAAKRATKFLSKVTVRSGCRSGCK